MVSRLALRRTALQVNRESEQAVSPPFWHRRYELAGIPVRIVAFSVGICPTVDRSRISVMKDPLDHARVKEESLDFLTVPITAFVGWLPINAEFVTHDCYSSFAIGCSLGAHRQRKNKE